MSSIVLTEAKFLISQEDTGQPPSAARLRAGDIHLVQCPCWCRTLYAKDDSSNH
jgi:hypothetical protein